MTGKELWDSILQQAIEGKLVPQRKEEGTAAELLQAIRKERAKLVKEGKLKKAKPLPAVKEEEKPFDIPDNWEWVRLGELLDIIGGVSYKKNDITSKGVRVLRGGNIVNEDIQLFDDDVFLPQSQYDNNKQIQINDVIIVASTGSKKVIGRPGFVMSQQNLTMIGAFLRICRPVNSLLAPYIRCIFSSEFYRGHIRDVVHGTNINNLKQEYITHFGVPLPPLAEQHRIVEKLETLKPLVESYGRAAEELEKLNRKFPEDLKKSLLQQAMEGKLVPRRKEEGTAAELLDEIRKERAKLVKEGKLKKTKPLPAVKEEEKPFDIPDSWEWVRLNDCLDVRDGTHDTPAYHLEGYPLVTSKNLTDKGIDFSNCKLISKEDYESINQRSKVDDGDILFAMIGTVGNPVLYHGTSDFSIKNMALFKHIGNFLDMEYVYWFLVMAQQEMKKKAAGAVQSFVSLSFLRNFLIPLPPLAEQHRIVKKLESLLALCDELQLKD
ncbi:restriction endonuclease subunit S [Dialister sp.]|uniref:restriction endonuclease subunit S n=1 Tax=Dialister sp. TaxID=1955814 RepID=UPI003F0BF8D4